MQGGFGLTIFRCSLLFALSYVVSLVLVGFAEYFLKLGISDYANVISLIIGVLISKAVTAWWCGRSLVVKESIIVAFIGTGFDFIFQLGVVLYFKGHEMLGFSNIAVTVMVSLGHGLVLLVGFISAPSILYSRRHAP